MLLKYGGKYLLCDAGKIKSCCIIGCDLRIFAVIGPINDKLKPKIVLVTPAMMGYKFPLPLDEDMAKLCRF